MADPRRLGRHLVSMALTNGIVLASGLATAPILARELGVGDRGLVAGATAPMLLIAIVVAFGMPDSIVYHIASNRRSAPRVARFAGLWWLMSSCVGVAATAALAVILGRQDPDTRDLMLVALLGLVPTVLLAHLRAIASGHGLWRQVNSEKLISAAGRLALIVGLALADRLTTLTAVGVVILTPVLSMVPYLGVTRRSRGAGGSCEPSFGDFSRFGAKVWVGSLSGVLLGRVDQVLMVPLSSAEALGLYVVAVSLGEVVLLVGNATRDVMLSSHAARPDNERLTMAGRLTFLLAGVLALSLLLAAPLLVPRLFGSAFSGAVLPTQILAVASAMVVPGMVAGAGLAARGRPHGRSVALFAGLFLNVVLLVALVPKFGALGASLGTLAGNLMVSGITIGLQSRWFGVNPAKFLLVTKGDMRQAQHEFGAILCRRSL